MNQVAVEDVSVAVDGHQILDQVLLNVQSGEFVGLVGPNGCGKSTLLRTIYRVLKPDAGQISYDGDDVWKLSTREAARRTAVVAQERMGEFDFTVGELVMMGRMPHKSMFEGDGVADRQIVEDALNHVDMATKATRRFMSLSGGEKQRVLVARALAQQARFLVLDEPTNHLDIRHQLDLLILLRQLKVTTLAALHDLNLAARYCDRIVMLDAGKIVAQGRPEDVLTPERIAEVYKVGARIERGTDNVSQINFFPLNQNT